jgi:hypothetical protein
MNNRLNSDSKRLATTGLRAFGASSATSGQPCIGQFFGGGGKGLLGAGTDETKARQNMEPAFSGVQTLICAQASAETVEKVKTKTPSTF